MKSLGFRWEFQLIVHNRYSIQDMHPASQIGKNFYTNNKQIKLYNTLMSKTLLLSHKSQINVGYLADITPLLLHNTDAVVSQKSNLPTEKQDIIKEEKNDNTELTRIQAHNHKILDQEIQKYNDSSVDKQEITWSVIDLS